jgi:hypothetical protein
MPIHPLGFLLLAASTLAGSGPAEVTRFHIDQPIAPGAIRIEPKPGGLPAGAEFTVYAGIVADELARLGFRQTPDEAEQLAVVNVTRTARAGMAGQRSGVSVSLNGGTNSYRRSGFDMGGIISFPIGKRRSNDETVTVTVLAVQIKRSTDGAVLWEGRAQSQARTNTAGTDPDVVVRRLAGALFQGFPGESGVTITVK